MRVRKPRHGSSSSHVSSIAASSPRQSHYKYGSLMWGLPDVAAPQRRDTPEALYLSPTRRAIR